MKRLTILFINDYGFTKPCDDLEHLQLVADKLGQLEDIEEQYDIDLIIFSKFLGALDRGWVYVKVKKITQYDGYSAVEETGEIEIKNIARFSRYINGTRDWFFSTSFSDISRVNNYLLKDFGKTWALTKGELEND